MEHISRQKCVACTNVTGPTHEYDIDGYKKRQCHPYALGWFHKGVFDFFRIMYPLSLNSPGSQESIEPNRFPKFDREHALGAKIKISSKKRVPGRISKNGWAKSILGSLENSVTAS